MLSLLVLSAALAGCVLRTPEDDCDVTIREDAELEIVDDAELARLSSNAQAGPLSFARTFGDLAGPRIADALRALGPEIEREVLCPWLQASAQATCDDPCRCEGAELDVAKAPFRLVAVGNRMDLGGKPGIAKSGEGRLVFAGTKGPGDDPASAPRPITVIFEYGLPDTKTPEQWATAWHALSPHPVGSAAHGDALAALVRTFAKRASLAQVRWNLAGKLLEARLVDGRLVRTKLRNTPPRSLEGSTALSSFVRANADAVAADMHLVPSSLLADETAVDGAPWKLAGVEAAVARAFALGTCGGCHAHDAFDGFHVSPFHRGAQKLSKTVQQDLPRRAQAMKARLCAAR